MQEDACECLMLLIEIIQTEVTVRKRKIWIKFDDYFSRVTLKFDWWPWKTIGHIFYATLSFVHHFVPIGEFKLKLQSGNTQFGSNSAIFRAVWPWNLTCDLENTGHLYYATSSSMHHFVVIGVFKLELHSGNDQSGSNSAIFSMMTLKNNAASSCVHDFIAICEFKLELESGNG